MTPTRRIYRAGLATLAGAALATMLAVVPAAAGTTPAPARTALPAAGPGSTRGFPGTRPAAPRPGQAAPLWRLARAWPGRYPGQHASPGSIGEPGGYDPGELRAYLGLKGTGAGQTVVVTEAYNVNAGHALASALATYDSWYGLRPACTGTVTTGCFRLTVTAPHGTMPNAGNAELNWQVEAELDTELIHALVPQAGITVVEAHDANSSSLAAALDYAQTLHPAVISNSWGTDEYAAEHSFDGHCPAAGAPCVFSSGDNGNYASCYTEGGAPYCSGYPAADPGGLAVGGTTLGLAPSGKVVSEYAWNGSGGGISTHEPFPAYQRGADPWTGGRGIPDVSFDADPNSGVAIYYHQALCRGPGCDYGQGWVEEGGTSAGAPAWAAILAATGQLRATHGRPPLNIGQIHTAVYAKTHTGIADITSGSNGICYPQCAARPGYDLVTGEGSPRPGIDSYLASR